MSDQQRVYLDSASSEPLHPAAREVMQAAWERGYADPRRLHGPGRDARLLLDNAREATAGALGVRPDEVTFTGSGTEAVHRGLLGLLREGAELAASAVEHSSVLHTGQWHARRGGGFRTIPVDALGTVDLSAIGNPDVVAVQSANHEVATLQPVSDIDSPALFVDACASGGRLPIPENAAVVALSAHKWGGPAGVGVMVVRHRSPWRESGPGDERAWPHTLGREAIPEWLGAAAALQAVVAEREVVNAAQSDLIARLREELAGWPDVDLAGHPDRRLPHLLTCSFLYLDGESIVTELDRAGYAVASGSACTASSLEPSHVLVAMGALTHGNIRISLTRDTTAEDLAGFTRALREIVDRLRAEAGVS